ncbi:BadF/BadG/BcrA/BcrD ATPase family protein [Microbacterium sp. NPDC019599]|uniref:N-acetylglucosamine kinase n=1 Tax=unclassified Microbacterium TaxID=2609290 RepID=UPI0013E155F8|nr:BadF/BadG/BcrA/BcrD ATPase family protein [Microbacterium sp. 4R-513]QIG39369.1 hypothetical protein G5T42_07640 [Microbacterium sp. 4R-513]
MTGRLTLAVDAGQTGTKVRSGGIGEPVEFVLPGVRTHEPLLPQLAESVRHVARELGGPVSVVSTGTSGLTAPDADASLLRALLDDVAPERVLLAHDSVTSFLGTLGDRRGAVVAAGTGVVTLAVGASTVARVDGWGNIMGDAGSAYWIGRAGLDAAMRGYDGRGPATPLTDRLRERWTDIEDAYMALQGDADRVRIVASFSETVSELAGDDATAADICRAAAAELALSVTTALRRVGIESTERPAVSAIGGVFRSPLVRDRFEQIISASHPDTIFEAAHGTGLDGAAALAALDAAHPLMAHVSEARSH